MKKKIVKKRSDTEHTAGVGMTAGKERWIGDGVAGGDWDRDAAAHLRWGCGVRRRARGLWGREREGEGKGGGGR